MSIKKIQTKIKNTRLKRDKLIDETMSVEKMVRGSYGETYRLCGKPTCWCAKADKGHLYKRITWGENAKFKTKAIPEEETEWIKTVTSTYQRFRKNRKMIRILDRQLNDLLNQFENKVIMKTNKMKKFL